MIGRDNKELRLKVGQWDVLGTINPKAEMAQRGSRPSGWKRRGCWVVPVDWNARVVRAVSRRMSSWTDCGWCLCKRAWRRPGRKEHGSGTDEDDESSMACSRPRVYRRDSRMSRAEERFGLVWAEDRLNHRNADLGDPKCNKRSRVQTPVAEQVGCGGERARKRGCGGRMSGVGE